MMRYGKMLLILLPFILCGCLEMTQKIYVNKDGGGRIVERVMMSKAGLKQLNDIFAAFPGAKGKKANKLDIYDKNKLMAEAEKYGSDVSYLSSKKVSTDTKEGYEVTYAFKDITTLRINQNPGDKGPATSDTKSPTKEENITFQFEKGTPATLTVLFPPQAKASKEKKSKAVKKDKAAEQKEADEMRDMSKDFYIGITVHPEGKIVETNATYSDNGMITLLEMDFAKLVADAPQFESFFKKEPKTIEEAKALLKTLPGFKVEMNQKVTITFE